MPTYRCTAPAGLLNVEAKAAVAREITRAHKAVTGAATFFAQVVFDEVPEGSYYLGGSPEAGPHIFVNAQIRAGRSEPVLQELVKALIDGVARAAGLPRLAVWVYLTELPARRMAEYGHVLPEPGSEALWLDQLPSDDRAHMLAVGQVR